MNRRPIFYGIVFILGFWILNKFFYIPITVGGIFLSGLLMFLLALVSDYWFLALARDSCVRIGITGMRNFTTVGAPEDRCIGKVGPLMDKNRNIGFPAVGIYPRAGLSSKNFFYLVGGGKKGYDIIPDFAIWENEDGGHQIVMMRPWRVFSNEIPQEWRDVLEKDKRYTPKAPLYFYYEPPENLKKILFPWQLVKMSKMPIGDLRVEVARLNDLIANLIDENHALSKRLMRRTREDQEERKKGLGDLILDKFRGEGDESEPDKFERA